MAKKADFPKSVVVTVNPPREGGRERFCQVDQAIACVRYGGTVTFKAANGCGPLTVFIPRPSRAPKVFPGLRKPHTRVRAGKRRQLKVLPEKHQTTQPREYPYAVYCHKHNCFAKGSLPRMMVGP